MNSSVCGLYKQAAWQATINGRRGRYDMSETRNGYGVETQGFFDNLCVGNFHRRNQQQRQKHSLTNFHGTSPPKAQLT